MIVKTEEIFKVKNRPKYLIVHIGVFPRETFLTLVNVVF